MDKYDVQAVSVVFLLAGRYSLLDHDQPLQRLFAKAPVHNAPK